MHRNTVARTASKKEKLISLAAMKQLLKDNPPGVRPHQVPIGDDPRRQNNHVLFRHFFVRQIKLARLVVRLRFPFANYIRNEIAEAVADRECKRLGVGNGGVLAETRRMELKRKHFARALETRHERDMMGHHSQEQKDKVRIRTQMLRHIHGACMKAADLCDEIEAAHADRLAHPRRYRAVEDKLTLWIVNSLSCFALMEMDRLSEREEDIPYVEGEDEQTRAQKLKLYHDMRLAARECSDWRNHIVSVNMGLAYRHVEMQSGAGDAGGRLSHAIDGLLQAVDRYNVGLPAPFEGFAPDWIRQAIQRGYQQQGTLIITPINVQKNAQKVKEYRDFCLGRAGLSPDEITRRMMLSGFSYRDTDTGRMEWMDCVKDAADGRDISEDALDKAMASPVLRSIDAPINDHGEGEGDTYPQLPSGDPNAAEQHMSQEQSSGLKRLIHGITTPAERVLLGFMTHWSDPAATASEYIDDLAERSAALTRERLERRTRSPRENRLAKVVLLESYQPAIDAPPEPTAKASGE